MIEKVYTILGTPLQSQKIVPGNTATAISRTVLNYFEYQIAYDSCDYTFVKGDVITGATSGAMGILISRTGTSSGVLRFKAWNGIAFTDDEKIKVGADSDVGDIDGSSPYEVVGNYDFKGAKAKTLLVSVKAQTTLIAFDGSTPDQTALLGHNIPAGGSYVMHDEQEMKQLKVIDAVASSASTVIVTAYF